MPADKAAPQEETLLRLFRCMTKDERAGCMEEAFQTLARRCSLDPDFKRLTPEQVRAECEVTEDEAYYELGRRLMAARPYDWPRQPYTLGWVDLSCVGGSDWLHNALGVSPADALFGCCWDDAGNAVALADSYYVDSQEYGESLPSSFADPEYRAEVDDMALFTEEFESLLGAWRERVLRILEEQNPREILPP